MSVTLALVNQKGGCGKTTSAIHLAAAFAAADCRVLLVDLDPQGHATLGLGQAPPDEGRVLADLLRSPGTPREGAVDEIAVEARDGLFLVPSTLGLAGLEVELAGREQPEQRLAAVLSRGRRRWDLVVIDCPPNLGLLTLNALAASRQVVIPFEASPFALQGVERAEQTLEALKDLTGHRLESWYLPTLTAARDRLGRAVIAEMLAGHPGWVLAPGIRRSVVFPQAASVGKTVMEYRPKCRAAMDYPRVAERLLGEWRKAGWLEEDDFTGLVQRGGDLVFSHRRLPPVQVRLAGDFNDWVPDGGVRLVQVEGGWEKRLTVPPGRYEYKFILAGRWSIDSANPVEVPNPRGTTNSVIVVTPVAREPVRGVRVPAGPSTPEAAKVRQASLLSARQRARMVRRHFRPSTR
ncbi:MAG: AAA family ATPase [Acidobacteriota bacterium]|nr:AAA family ATPase [Acidobacteriota bacterium]MDQ7087570.1 AAA family ATPase [Acidobacteriota bacterium]